MKFQNWRAMVEHYDPTFSVQNVGDFWTLLETGRYAINIARFINIPPHLHRNSREEFYFLEGSGVLYCHGDVILKDDKKFYWDAKTRVRDFVEKGEFATIAPNIPHCLVTEGIYVGLITKPPIKRPNEPDDEVPLMLTNL